MEQALLTHEGLCMDPRPTDATHDFPGETHMFPYTPVELRSTTDLSSIPSSPNCRCSVSHSIDHTIFDDMDLQEGYLPSACDSERSLSKSKSVPETKPSIDKIEDMRWSSDCMLFDSYNFTRTGITPPVQTDHNVSDQSDEMMFTSPSRSSTATSLVFRNPWGKSRRRSSMSRRNRGSDASIMSDEDRIPRVVPGIDRTVP